MTDLSALLDLVSKAEGRDNALSADILNALGDQAMDRGKLGWTWRPNGFGIWHNLPDLCSSLDAALALYTRALPGWEWCMRTDEAEGFYANAFKGSPNEGAPCWPRYAKTPALALLAAMLSALIATSETKGLEQQ